MAGQTAPPESMPDPLERRLATILTADVAGYSRMMGEDEEATIQTLPSRRIRRAAQATSWPRVQYCRRRNPRRVSQYGRGGSLCDRNPGSTTDSQRALAAGAEDVVPYGH